jgi:hypothetical protein
LHVFDEGGFLGVGVIFHILRRLFGFGLDLLDLLRGGLLFVAAYQESDGGEQSNSYYLMFHNAFNWVRLRFHSLADVVP